MTVKKLIELLQKEDPSRTVIMSKDAEGNSYSPLADFWAGKYKPDSTWSGEVGMETLTKADIKAGYSELDVLRSGKPAIILQPVN